MKRDTWLGLGIAGLACLLMCAGTPSGGMEDDAASEETPAPAGARVITPRTPAATPQAPAPVPQQQPGTGGSGTNTQAPAGTAPGTTPAQGTEAGSDPNSPSAEPNPEGQTTPPNPGPETNSGTGGTGNTGTGAPSTAKPSAPGASQGVAVVDAIYRGKVRSVSDTVVVIDNDGSRLPLEISTQTRVVRDGEDIGVTELKEGERVRATVNLVGRSHTREIAVLTGAEARRDAETQRRR
ncbi:hypothetical protein HJC22_25060 [Corallococcus exiguus]|uniref:hypothetical protein n=1 Tax=Corallococcus TaxID=83461 RepID=UPI000EE922C7|nr:MULTISPECIES: hypothetical protein [Corallococcus]NNC18989.1 hypothetical protein [Corallococcus exiguus]NRD55972.1 hypothetical protein [Corallococcus exiguus]RKH22261.1 hypothetical protein D7V77_27630 [Corallococcus sp. CA041A]